MKQTIYAMPQALAESPELGVLAILDHTLQQAAYALYAVHPQLVDQHHPIQAKDIDAALCLADIMAEQIASLQWTIVRYREVVTVEEKSCRQGASPGL